MMHWELCGKSCRDLKYYLNAYRVLVGNPEGKTPLRGPTRRLEDNIKKDIREI
jgi:hypothetical protein